MSSLCIHVREIQSEKDIRVIQDISAESAITPLTRNDIAQDNSFVFVAEHSERMLAYMIVRLHSCRPLLADIAVTTSLRRHGIGSQLFSVLYSLLPHGHGASVVNISHYPLMFVTLRDRLAQGKYRSLNLMVRDTNLVAQKFFRHLGFKAYPKIHWHYFQDTGEDGYFMRFDLQKPKAITPALPVNCSARFGYGRGL